MATKYQCDKCETQHDKPLHNTIIPAVDRDYGNSMELNKDLCDTCLRQLREWVKVLPKLATKEKYEG